MHRDPRIARVGPTASQAARTVKSGTQSAVKPTTKPTLSKCPKSGNLSGKLGGGPAVAPSVGQIGGRLGAGGLNADAYEEAPHCVSAGTGPFLHGGGEGNRTPDTGIFSVNEGRKARFFGATRYFIFLYYLLFWVLKARAAMPYDGGSPERGAGLGQVWGRWGRSFLACDVPKHMPIGRTVANW